MMTSIVGFIYNSGGRTLNSSPLLQLFRKHVLTVITSDYLTKENFEMLEEITREYRNKAAHTTNIDNSDTEKFHELGKNVLDQFLNSIKKE